MCISRDIVISFIRHIRKLKYERSAGMIRKSFVAVILIVGLHSYGGAAENDYHVLCTNVIAALSNKRALTSPSFTNQLHVYISGTNVQARILSRIVLSDVLLTMYDKSSDFGAYDEGFLSCSNVLFSGELPVRSWQKSVASLFYAWALRIDGKKDLAFEVCRTALASHLASPTTEVERAVWLAMCREDGLPEMSITNSLKLAAALSMSDERQPSEFGIYTNSLPPQAIQILLE